MGLKTQSRATTRAHRLPLSGQNVCEICGPSRAVARLRETALTSSPCCVLSPVPLIDVLDTLYEPDAVFGQSLGSAIIVTVFLLLLPLLSLVVLSFFGSSCFFSSLLSFHRVPLFGQNMCDRQFSSTQKKRWNPVFSLEQKSYQYPLTLFSTALPIWGQNTWNQTVKVLEIGNGFKRPFIIRA